MGKQIDMLFIYSVLNCNTPFIPVLHCNEMLEVRLEERELKSDVADELLQSAE